MLGFLPAAFRTHRYRVALLALLLLLPSSLFLGAGLGAYPISPLEIPSILLRGEGVEYQVLTVLRFPRVVTAALVGALLATAGAVLQGLFRNPLVDPGLIGVSAGAALGASLFIVLLPGGLALAQALQAYGLPLFAFLGGLLTTWFLWRIANTPAGVQVAVLLLGGIALNALVGAAIGFLIFLADDEQLRSLTFWTLGGFTGATWGLWVPALPFAAMAFLLLLPLARELNALALGEREAFHLGVHLETLKRRAVAGTALAVGAAVALAGGVGFVGLVAPTFSASWLGRTIGFSCLAQPFLGPASWFWPISWPALWQRRRKCPWEWSPLSWVVPSSYTWSFV